MTPLPPVETSSASSLFSCLYSSSLLQCLAERIVNFVANIFACLTSFFIREEAPAARTPPPPAPSPPPVIIETDPPEDPPMLPDEPVERALVVRGTRAVQPYYNIPGRFNLQEMAKRVQWIRPEQIPRELRRFLPPGIANIGIFNLPQELYNSLCIPQPLPLLELADGQEPLPFLFDGSVPLDGSESSESEMKSQGSSLQGSMNASWVQVSPEAVAQRCAERRAVLGFEGPENILPYLSDALSKEVIRDTDAIIFEEGKIRGNHSQNSREIFYLLLERTYGASLADRVAMTESLLAEGAPPLTWGKVKEVVVGIAAQARVADFELLFRKIKGERVEGFLCADSLMPEQRAAIAEVSSFQELRPEHIEILEQAFRTISFQGKAKPTLEAFFPKSKKYPQGFWSSSRFILNARILQTLGYIHSLDPDNLSLATAEYLGKTTSYLTLEEGMVIPLPSSSNRRIYFKVERVFKKDGVVFQLLTPVTEGQQREDDLKTLYLNFRGTQAKVSVEEGAASLLRDVNWRGIGANFRDEDVIDALRPYIGEKQILKINGHSLGGVDAQRALVGILEAIEQDQLPLVKKIEVYCFNSPAPEPRVNERCKGALRSLEGKSKSVSVDLTYVRFESDPVQGLGDIFVGASNESGLLGVRIVTFSSQQIRSLKAHGAIACNNTLRSAEFQSAVIDRFTPGGLLEKILSHNYFWDAENSSFVSRAGDAVQWYGSALGAAVIKPLHFIFYEGSNLLCILANSLSPDRALAQSRREYRELRLLRC